MFKVEDFEGLKCTNYKFSSDKGQMLMGYWYSAGSKQRGIITLAHGFGGGGHNSYMDCINYFAQHGYYVFAYDATGNDESMVRKYIQEIKIYEYRFKVCFKAGIELDVPR